MLPSGRLSVASGTEEHEVVDPLTGGKKGSKLERFDLIPWDQITELARHFGRGARKYEDRNWERGYAWSLSYAALLRHLTQWWQGEDVDQETGSSHLIAVAWHALALAWFQRWSKGTDDRPRSDAGAPPARSGNSPHYGDRHGNKFFCAGYPCNSNTAHWHEIPS